MIKTILILTIAAAFMVGTSMSLVLSDYEAEAKPKKPKPIPPIFKPINATLNQLESYEEQLALIHFKFVATGDGIGTSPLTVDEATDLLDALEQIELEAEEISDLAIDTIEDITISPICGNEVVELGEQCDPPFDEGAPGCQGSENICTNTCQILVC